MLHEFLELLTVQDSAPLTMVATFPAAFEIAEPELVIVFRLVPEFFDLWRGEVENVLVGGNIDGVDHGELHRGVVWFGGVARRCAWPDAARFGVSRIAGSSQIAPLQWMPDKRRQ